MQNTQATQGTHGTHHGTQDKQTKNIKKRRRKTATRQNTLNLTQMTESAGLNMPKLSFGTEEYVIPAKEREIIGEEIAASCQSLPAAFGKPLRDISKYHNSYKASELVNFMHLISPIVLMNRLPEIYYEHWHKFVLTSEKLRKYSLTAAEVDELHTDITAHIEEHEALYYQYI